MYTMSTPTTWSVAAYFSLFSRLVLRSALRTAPSAAVCLTQTPKPSASSSARVGILVHVFQMLVLPVLLYASESGQWSGATVLDRSLPSSVSC